MAVGGARSVKGVRLMERMPWAASLAQYQHSLRGCSVAQDAPVGLVGPVGPSAGYVWGISRQKRDW